MINTKLLISGIQFEDYRDLLIRKSNGDYSTTSYFEATLDSPYGRHANDFQVGREVVVYADKNKILPNNSPILFFKFNNSGTTIIDEISGIIGSPVANGGSWVNGIVGSAITFSGTQAYNLFNTNAQFKFSEGSPFTLMAWGKFISGTMQTGANNGFFGKGNLATCNWAIDYTGSPIRHRFGTRSGTFTMAVNSPQLPTNTWYHVAGTYNGSNALQIFFNGVPSTSLNTNGSIFNGGLGSIVFGRTSIINGNNGSEIVYAIDDARVYNYNLSNNEIYSIYNDGNATEQFNNGSQLLFRGLLETVSFRGQENDEKVNLSGRDYSARLMDATIEPVVYSNQEIGSLVKNIVSTGNIPDITTNNVGSTGITLPRVTFNHDRTFDAIQRLAEFAGFFFYVDDQKDLHFEARQTTPQNLNLGSENVLTMNFDTTRQQMSNKVWVYGDRYFSKAATEIFTSGGSTGSVYTLIYNPHNTQVQTSNVMPGSNLKGGIFNMQSTNITSGVDYLVNFHDRQIILLSGTTIGYSTFLNNNGSIVIDYDRELPIVKYGQDDTSIVLYGPKTQVINDKSIKDPNEAVTILNRQLQDANPLRSVSADLQGWYSITPGKTVTITMPHFGINSSGISIIEASYNFNNQTIYQESPITLSMSKKPYDLMVELKDLNLRLKALENSDIKDSDFLTRLFTSKESVMIVGSQWTFKARWNGSEFRFWSSNLVPPLGSNFTPILGLLSSGTGLGAGSMSYLASGAFGNPYQIFFSGGNNYSLTGSYNISGAEPYLPGGGFL